MSLYYTLKNFCSLLTPNWEVSTGRLHYSFINFNQITQKFISSSYIDDIETNLPIGKHTMRVIKRHFEKNCFLRFGSVLHLCVCLHLFQFMSLLTIFAVERCVLLTVTHTFKCNQLKLENWSK